MIEYPLAQYVCMKYEKGPVATAVNSQKHNQCIIRKCVRGTKGKGRGSTRVGDAIIRKNTCWWDAGAPSDGWKDAAFIWLQLRCLTTSGAIKHSLHRH